MKVFIVGLAFTLSALTSCVAQDSVTVLPSGEARLTINGVPTVYDSTEFQTLAVEGLKVFAFLNATSGQTPRIVLESRDGEITLLPFDPKYRMDYTAIDSIKELSNHFVAVVFHDNPRYSLFGVIDLSKKSIYYYYGSDVAADNDTVVVVSFRYNPSNPNSPCYVYVDNQYVGTIPLPPTDRPYVEKLNASEKTLTIGDLDNDAKTFEVSY